MEEERTTETTGGLDEDRPWDELARLAKESTGERIGEYLDALPPNDVALAVSRLSESQQVRVVTLLSPEAAADVVEQLPDVQAVDILQNLEPTAAAAIIDALPSSEQADLIGEMDDDEAEAILERMEPTEAAGVRALALYEHDVAGGLMVTELLRYRESARVEDVLEDMRQNAERYRDYNVQYAYVEDSEGRLTGVLRLRDLVLASRQTPIERLMIREPRSIRDDASLESLLGFFDAHHFLGVPIVDDRSRLLGVVHREAVDEARSERDERNLLKMQGIIGGLELRTMALSLRARRRFAWLSVNILLNVMAASIIAAFQETIAAVIALAVFLPIISDMSGCSGNQAVAVSLREMSMGLVRPRDLVLVWLSEIKVGVINGIALGAIIAAVTTLWMGNPYLGLAIGLALCLNTMIAVSIGGTIPLILGRFGVDPAIASGPILTTITDMCGFLLTLGIATLMLDRLVG